MSDMAGSTLPIWVKAYDGDLEADVARWRSEGLSVERVAQRLHDRGVTITTRTLYRWLRDGLDSNPEVGS